MLYIRKNIEIIKFIMYKAPYFRNRLQYLIINRYVFIFALKYFY